MQVAFFLVIAISAVAAQFIKPCLKKDICASDGVTYNNTCSLIKAAIRKPGLRQVYLGKCGEPTLAVTPCPCPLYYRPVCGNDGKTYSTKCEYECTKKTFPELEMIHEGDCGIFKCGLDPSAPVCGTDGVSYREVCVLKYEQKSRDPTLKVIYEGKCGKPKDEKQCVCPGIFSPICANDGKTYGNKCYFKCAKEQFPYLEERNVGPCRYFH